MAIVATHQVNFTNEAYQSLINLDEYLRTWTRSIVVDGCEPFSEDLWTEIKIKDFTFEGVRLCSRCKIPTINQETGIAGPEPNATLKAIRSDKVLRPTQKQQGKIYFGQNMVWKDRVADGKRKMMKVGDPVYVIKKVSRAAEAVA